MKASAPLPAFQFMSDLHLERIKYTYEVERSAPTLILGGDIGRFRDYDQYCGFLSKLCQTFDLVLLIAGNHEYYGSSRDAGLDAAKNLEKEPGMHGKLRFLDRTRLDLPDSNVSILGCTLQSHIGDGYTKLTNDFQRIESWSVKAHNEEHRKDVEWLMDTLDAIRRMEPKRKVVVVTHYAPSFERVCHPLNENNAVSQCFSSHTLRRFHESGLLEQATFWIFGHTHWNTKFKFGTCTVTSNQLCNDDKRLSWWQRKTIYRPFNPQAVIQV